METFGLAGSADLCRYRQDITPEEAFKTRAIRVDLPSGRARDPLRPALNSWLRELWHFRLGRVASLSASAEQACLPEPHHPSKLNDSYQNTILLADMIASFLVAMLACVSLVVPLVLLSYQETKETHLLRVSVCIMVFSLLIGLASKVSNQGTMTAATAYAAVLAVFVGSVPPTPSQ
jgi:hypothetical protein